MQENKRALTPEEVEKYRRKLRENDIRYNTDCEIIDGPVYDVTQGQETIVKRVPSGVGHWLKPEAFRLPALPPLETDGSRPRACQSLNALEISQCCREGPRV